ncbi:MAG: trigger factor [Alphaproteobacteria bacterium]
MPIHIEKIGHQKESRDYVIRVPYKSLALKIQALLFELQKEVVHEGYPDKKVPIQKLKEDFLPKILPKAVDAIVKEQKARIFREENILPAGTTKVEIMNLKEGETLIYKLHVPVLEELSLAPLDDIELTEYKIQDPDDATRLNATKTFFGDYKEDPNVLDLFLREPEKLEEVIYQKLKTFFQISGFNKLKKDLKDALLEKHDFIPPEHIILFYYEKGLKEALLSERKEDFESKIHTLSLGELEAYVTPERSSEIKKDAFRKAKLGAILWTVRDYANIGMTEEEVKMCLLGEASLRTGHEQDFLNVFNDPEALQAFQEPLLEEKILCFILERVKVNEKEVSFDEFKELSLAA